MREQLQKQTTLCESLEAELSLSISETLALDAQDPTLEVVRIHQSALRNQLRTLKANIALSQELLHRVLQDPLLTVPSTS